VPVVGPRDPEPLIVAELWLCMPWVLPIDDSWEPLRVEKPLLCVPWVILEEVTCEPVKVEEPEIVSVPVAAVRLRESETVMVDEPWLCVPWILSVEESPVLAVDGSMEPLKVDEAWMYELCVTPVAEL
jgi:hypothetical protein